MARVYLPTTLADLGRYVADGRVPASADRFVAAEEDEESEYAALMAAAEASAGLGATRRVVLVAEVEDPDGDVPLDRLAAVHADTRDDVPPEEDLGWFGVQEIPVLLAGPSV
jgi:hypothetical protein